MAVHAFTGSAIFADCDQLVLVHTVDHNTTSRFPGLSSCCPTPRIAVQFLAVIFLCPSAPTGLRPDCVHEKKCITELSIQVTTARATFFFCTTSLPFFKQAQCPFCIFAHGSSLSATLQRWLLSARVLGGYRQFHQNLKGVSDERFWMNGF